MTRTTTPGAGRPDRVTSARDPDDWTDAGTFERAEQAGIDVADDAAVLPDDLGSLPPEADEADVMEQYQEVGDAGEDEEPRESPTAEEFGEPPTAPEFG